MKSSRKIKTKTRRKIVKKSQPKSFGLIFIVGVMVVMAFFGGYLYYRSYTNPNLHEEKQMTTIPKDVSRALTTRANHRVINEEYIRIPILMYHYVEYVQDKNDTTRIKLTTSPYTLKAQIETLKSAGYTFITPSDLANALDGKVLDFPQKPIILSFDDGYRDLYTDVFPILQEENVKGVAYIIVNYLNRQNFLLSSQLEELAKSPLLEIGAHTMNHVGLKGVKRNAAWNEIIESRKFLQKMLNLPIYSFAYPYGSFDQQAIDLVNAAGFTNAVSTIPGIKDTIDTKYYLYRLRPGGRTGIELLTFLAQDKFKPW